MKGLAVVVLLIAIVYAALNILFVKEFIVHKSGAILITGSSTGIGFDAARALAAQGYTVFGTVRKESDFLALEVMTQKMHEKQGRKKVELDGVSCLFSFFFSPPLPPYLPPSFFLSLSLSLPFFLLLFLSFLLLQSQHSLSPSQQQNNALIMYCIDSSIIYPSNIPSIRRQWVANPC